MAKIKVSVERIDGSCSLPVLVGDHFYVEDSKLYVPAGSLAPSTSSTFANIDFDHLCLLVAEVTSRK